MPLLGVGTWKALLRWPWVFFSLGVNILLWGRERRQIIKEISLPIGMGSVGERQGNVRERKKTLK